MKKEIIHGIKAIVATVMMLTGTTACDNGYDCSLNNTSYNNIGFYTDDEGTEAEYSHPGPLDIYLILNGNDSLMINHLTDASEISLPMSYALNTDTVVIAYNDGLSDSLYITHTNTPYYQSMECGTLMFHKLEEVHHTNIWIDSVAVVDKNVNFEGNENIKIYFYQ